MKKTLFIIALILLTNLATYFVCVSIYERGYRDVESKNDTAMKVLKAYESRFKLTEQLTDLVVSQYKATNEGDFQLSSSLNQQITDLQPKFQESNRELEQIINDASINN